ncbi:hypothetical protein BG004_006330 [Podila humilis]|nr:hypothetical protein BG004_006330 [Podila humilis]
MSLEDQALPSDCSDDEHEQSGQSLSDLKSVPSAIALLKKPVVLIVGAGLGGLMLGLLLQKAGIEFFIFERAAKVRPLGSALSISSNILPVLEQLGLLEDVEKFSYPISSLDMFHESLQSIGTIDLSSFNDITGYSIRILARHELYDLMLSKVEPSRLLFNKKVLSTQQNPEGVMVRTADNSMYHGDILVGADGAYSAVRESLYAELEQKGLLPSEDREEMHMASLSMVGTTKTLSPEQYPILKDGRCNFSTVLPKGKPHSITSATLPNNRIAWGTTTQISRQQAEDMMFRSSDWGTEAHKSLIDEMREFPVKIGGTLGDLIDATESDLVSKVYIEEKLFQTWNYGRTGLLGDAVHKMQPGAGQGAVAAMQDAVILANSIYDIEDPTYENIQAALSDYRSQRFVHAEAQVELAKTMSRVMFGQKWYERLLRKIIYNLPKWAQTQSHMRVAAYSPMVMFLPPPPTRATIKLLPQKPSMRYGRDQALQGNKNGSEHVVESSTPSTV